MYIVRSRTRRGLAAYPTDPYYDPSRPSWLPYWIDTPTESEAKAAYYANVAGINVGATPQQIANPSSQYPVPPALTQPPVGPSTSAQETVPGAWTPDQALAATAQLQQQQNQAFFDWLGQNLSSGVPTSSGLSMTALIALGLVGGGALLLLSRRRR